MKDSRLSSMLNFTNVQVRFIRSSHQAIANTVLYDNKLDCAMVVVCIRSAMCDYNHTPAPRLSQEHICGRPLGLRFEKRTGELYIADGYFGILKVGPQGGLAEPVVTEVNGDPFKFCNDLDFDEDGNLYFTVSSTKYQRR